MSALFSHAIRWEWTERNPNKSVRQSAKRMRTPDVLTPEEIMALLKNLPEPSNGGRAGRFHWLATWRPDRLAMGRRGFREPRNPCSPFSRDDGQGAPKTEASAKDVPLDAALAESLLKLRLAGP